MTKLLRYKIIPIATLFPSIAFGFSLSNSTFIDVIAEILSVLDILIPILSAIAFLIFFWGLSKFILNSDNQAEIQKGRNYMFWGVLAIFILITYRTIVSLVATDLEIGDGKVFPTIPQGTNTSTGCPSTGCLTSPPGGNSFP